MLIENNMMTSKEENEFLSSLSFGEPDSMDSDDDWLKLIYNCKLKKVSDLYFP